MLQHQDDTAEFVALRTACALLCKGKRREPVHHVLPVDIRPAIEQNFGRLWEAPGEQPRPQCF